MAKNWSKLDLYKDEVIELAQKGMSNTYIASKYCVTYQTVTSFLAKYGIISVVRKNQIKNIKKKNIKRPEYPCDKCDKRICEGCPYFILEKGE